MVFGTELFVSLFGNLAIFIVLIALYGWLLERTQRFSSVRSKLGLGFLFGLTAVGCMHAAIPLQDGVLVDQRNAVIVLAGAFGGGVPTLVAAVITGTYRIYLGGSGMLAGVLGCAFAAIGGIMLYALRDRIDSLLKAAAGTALAIAIILPAFLFIGDLSLGLALLTEAGPAYAAAIFSGVFLTGLLLHASERRYEAEINQRLAVERLKDFAASGSDWLWETDAEHRFVFKSGEPDEHRVLWFDSVAGTAQSEAQRLQFYQLLRRREAFRDFEFSHRGADGEMRFTRVSGKPFHGGDGAFLGFRGSSSDRTEEKRALAALQRNEKMYADIAASSFDRFWVTDENHRYIFATDSSLMRSRGGRPGKLFMGNTLWEMLGADPDLDDAMGQYRTMLNQHKPFRNFRIDMVLPNGQVSHREVSGTPVFDDSGEFKGFRGSTRDISDMVAATETLRTSEENYRALIDGSVQGVFIHRDFKPIYANQSCVDIFGYPDIDAVMKLPSVLQFWAPYEARRMDDYRRGRLRGDIVPERFEAEGRRMDGSQIWLMTTAKVIQWDGSAAIQTTVIDITDRRRAEEALQQSSARMRAVLDATPLAIAALDTEMRVTMWTRAAEAMYGWTEEEVFGKLPPNIPEAEQSGYREATQKARQSQSVVITETKRLCKDGRLIDVRLFVAPIENENGKAVGFLGVAEDITEQKAIERQLRQSQKMDAIGQLTGGIAHDFNNLLGVILGNLDFAAENIDDTGTAMQMINNAVAAANRGAELNRHLLAFSRQMPLDPEVIDLNVQVSAMTDLLRRTLAESIEIEFVRGAGLWNCEADPGQVESALLNLCLNARDAMPAGGRLTIETANARLDDEYVSTQTELTVGQYVLLAVTDNGVGMPADIREKAFEPFFTTKEVDRGTGLGLSMVFGFAKQSGGHLAIYSEEGEGTTVKLYLPRASRPITAAMPPRVEIPLGHGERILVVEDHEQLRDLVVSQLKGLGYTVAETEDGAEALAVLRDGSTLDLVLTDVVLPAGMNGTQVAAEAERLHPGIGVVYMSGYTENAVIHHGRLDEGVSLLQKPFRREELARKVREILDSRE